MTYFQWGKCSVHVKLAEQGTLTGDPSYPKPDLLNLINICLNPNPHSGT